MLYAPLEEQHTIAYDYNDHVDGLYREAIKRAREQYRQYFRMELREIKERIL